MAQQHQESHRFRSSRGEGSKHQASNTIKHSDSKQQVSSRISSDSRSNATGSVVSFAEIAKQKLRKARLLKKRELQLKAKEEEEK